MVKKAINSVTQGRKKPIERTGVSKSASVGQMPGGEKSGLPGCSSCPAPPPRPPSSRHRAADQNHHPEEASTIY